MNTACDNTSDLVQRGELVEGDGQRVYVVFGDAGELLGVTTSAEEAAKATKNEGYAEPCVLNDLREA